MTDRLLTLPEAAEELPHELRHLRRLARAGRIPAERVGVRGGVPRAYLIREADLPEIRETLTKLRRRPRKPTPPAG